MRFLKTSFLILTFLLAMPVMAFFAYDIFYFQPYSDEIKTIIANASPEDRNPPLLVQRLVRVSEPQGIERNLSRIIFYHLDTPRTRESAGQRITKQVLWQLLFRLHLTEKERMALYCSLVYTGNNDSGLSTASLRLFNKPLSELSASQAATVVALTWGPRYYEKRPDALAERRDLLLQRLSVGL